MTLKSLNIMRIDVKFSWTPAYTGINGNEIADQLAKKATKKRISRLKTQEKLNQLLNHMSKRNGRRSGTQLIQEYFIIKSIHQLMIYTILEEVKMR